MNDELDFARSADLTQTAGDETQQTAFAGLPERIGRYQVLSLLGRGGMGAVYLGLDTGLGRRVALKVLAGAGGSAARERFAREAKAVAALNHPGICGIYSIEDVDGRLFLVLEYLEGKTFRQLLDEGRTWFPPKPAVAAKYILQAADALRVAHNAGVIHRDIKCGNLMLTPGDRVKVLDFGIAKVSGSHLLTQEGSTIGTPAYSSPEQARGGSVDARTDLWSLGVVFYEILTGRLPFPGDNVAALTQAILSEEPEPVRTIRPGVPLAMSWVIQKLLSKNADQRYPSAAALMAELAPLVEVYGVESEPLKLEAAASGSGRVSSSVMETRLGTTERRSVTFLHVELVAPAGGLDLAGREAALEESRQMCARIAAQHEGYLQPWVGNKVSICFGYPRAREDAALLGVSAGLALAKLFERSSSGFSYRGGVETSAAIVDISGVKPLSGVGFQLSGRLCEAAGTNQVLAGEETRRQVAGRFELGAEGIIDLPGGGTLRFSRVLNASTARSRFQAMPEAALSPLVGREQEMRILVRHWENAVEGHGNVILLGGAPGIGKSRLSYELKRHVAQDRSAALIECFCAPQYANTALYPVIDCFERLVFESDQKQMDPPEKLRVLEGVLAALGFSLAETVPLFAWFLGLSAPGYAPLEVTPDRRRWLALEALATLLVERAARQPLLFIVEDLHWADPTTHEFIKMLVDRLAAVPMLALYTHRPEYLAGLPQRSHVSTVSLNRLSRGEALQIASAASRQTKLDTGTLNQIVGNSDGVPLFLEEMTKTVVETGGNSKSGKLPVPATLRDSFAARLDQLGSARNVVRVAAILGREFPEPLLAALAELRDDELRECVDRLIEAEILHVRGIGGRRTLIFKHALLQEAAYESLLREARQGLHARAAELLTEKFPDVAARQPEIVGRHLTEAGLGAQAIPYWHQAGMAALQRSAYLEAVSQFERGLEVYHSLGEDQRNPAHELLLLTGLGPALLATRGFGAVEVGETYSRAEQLIPQEGHSPLLLPALWGVWVYSLVSSNLQQALATNLRMVETGKQSKDDAMLLEGHWTAGNTLYWKANLAESRRHLEAAEAMYDPARFDSHAYLFGQDSLVGALCYQSFTYCFLGEFQRAVEASDKSIQRARALRHPFSIGWALTFRATLNGFLGSYESAREIGDQAVRYCQEQAYPFWISAALSAAGHSQAEMGLLEEGIAKLREGIAMTRAIGSRVIEPLYRGQLAEALLLKGDAEGGHREVAEAIVQAEEQGVGISRFDLLRVRGLALRGLGKMTEAKAALHHCVTESRTASCRYTELRAATHLGEFWNDREPLKQVLQGLENQSWEPPVLRHARDVLRRN